MGRLFISEREINFINDITKELIKDVIGQKIYYFSINEIKTNIHDVYEEAVDKIFENPIALECLVKYSPQEIKTNRFGSEEIYSIECYIHERDMIDKGISVVEGDFFSYGSTFFEVIKSPASDTIFGQIEYKSYITITGKQSRKGQFLSKIFGPTSERYSDSDAIQDTFVQQRGYSSNSQGATGDVRALQNNGVLTTPISQPAEVSPSGDTTGAGSSFYDES